MRSTSTEAKFAAGLLAAEDGDNASNFRYTFAVTAVRMEVPMRVPS